MTISNIHIGLAAWQTSHSYSIGNRVSSAGNAYQAISSGTSGATTPTGTGTSISDGAVNWKYLSAINYSSLTAWGNAIPSTLSSNVVGQVWNNGTITTTLGTPFLTLGVSGSPRNTGIYSITLTCAPGESFRDKLKGTNTPLKANAANGVCFQLPSGIGSTNYFDIYDYPVTFSGLQFIDPYPTSNSTIINNNASTVTSLSQCIFDGFAQGNGAYMLAFSNTLHMSNCLFIDRQSAANQVALIVGSSASTIVNTTFVCPVVASTLTYVTRTSGGSVTDASGHVFTMDSSGNMYDNGNFIPPSAGTAQITVVSGVIWAQDQASGTWYTYVGGVFYQQSGSPTGGASLGGGTAYSTYSGTPLSRNNIFCGYANALGNGVLADHCAFTSSSVGYGTNNGSNQFSIVAANQFLSATTDFRLKIGSTCINTGVTDTTDIPLSNDIIGYSRPQGTAWGLGAAEFTGQFKATNSLGLVKVTATIATANNASSTRIIATFKCVATAQQIDLLSAIVSIKPISLIGQSYQVIYASLSRTIGLITSTGSGFATSNIVFGTISLTPTIIATAKQSDLLTTQSTIGAINTSATAAAIDATYALASIDPIAILATADQFALAAATQSFALSSIALISLSNIDSSAQISLSIVALATAQQIDDISATIGIGEIAIVTAVYQSDITSSIVSIVISSNITARQDDNETSINNIIFSCAATIGQYAPTYTVGLLGPITLVGTMNSTYLVTATPSITISQISNALQSDLLSFAGLIGIIATSSTTELTNPLPAVATVTLDPISTFASAIGFTYLAAATVSIGEMTCIASSGVFTGTITLELTCDATADNPYPLTAQVSIDAFSCIGLIESLVPILASATATVDPLALLATAAQLDLGSALISLVVNVRATVTNAPRLRVSQLPIETLASGGALRVTQATIETLASGGALRISQTAIEILTQSALPSAGRVSQIVGEVLASGTARARTSQVVQEVLTGGSALQNVRISQVVTEVMTGGSTTQNVMMSQIILETLISAVPLNIISTTYIAV